MASGRPPAAVSIIRISGPDAHAAGERLSGTLPPPRVAAVRRLVHPQSGELLDDALLLKFDAPASANGEDTIELHCHGGRAVVQAVTGALGGLPGLRLAEPGEFTRRAFENGRIDLTQAEGLADLIEAETEGQRRAALQLAEGGLRSQIEQWREQLLMLSARAEQAIDYADEDGGEVSAEDQLFDDCASFAAVLREWLSRPAAEPLKEGVRVVVAGPPNAGKSSLVNAIVGYERAIVSATPGTTRDHIEVPLALAGTSIILTDTAGMRLTQDEVEAEGVARAGALAQAADILLWLGDDSPPDHERTILVHARADLAERVRVPADRLPVSAVTGTGISELLEAVAEVASTLVPAPDAFALNKRHRQHLSRCKRVISDAIQTIDSVIVADALRDARSELDAVTGRSGIEDVLDALFSRFCLGK